MKNREAVLYERELGEITTWNLFRRRECTKCPCHLR